MKQNIVLLIAFVAICSCTPRSVMKDPYMTTAEVTHKVDSLAKTFYVDAKLNQGYLEQHPLKVSEMEKLKKDIISSSPIYNKSCSDSIGEFIAQPVTTEKDMARIKELKDSLLESHAYDGFDVIDTICLSDHYHLRYGVGFSCLDTDHIWVSPVTAYFVDNLTNDSIKTEVWDLVYARLGNAPLVFAFAFKFKHDGHTYVFHRMFDVRTDINLNSGKSAACYRIK